MRGELLVEHERGGLDRYIGTAGPLAAGFTFTEPTRIEAINGWMTGSDQMKISIAMDFPDRVIYSQEFTGSFIPGLPGKWQGVSGLKWDLQPGTYFVIFEDGYFPIAYGGPASTAPQGFESFQYFDSGWNNLGFPIGARVYGNALSAVPEPATYGVVAGLALVGLTVLRQRSARLKTSRPARS